MNTTFDIARILHYAGIQAGAGESFAKIASGILAHQVPTPSDYATKGAAAFSREAAMMIDLQNIVRSALRSGALLLSAYAEEVWGPHWTANDLVRAFGIDLRTVQRWFSGNKEPPKPVLEIMRELCGTLKQFRDQGPPSSVSGS